MVNFSEMLVFLAGILVAWCAFLSVILFIAGS